MFRSASSGDRLWRVAALALLLCAAFDILAVDTALWRPAGSADSSCGCPDEDDCFCCCRHIAVVQPLVLRPLLTVITAVDQETLHPESVPTPVPFHPPRA